MGRLTTNKPASEMSIVELAHNCCYADKDMNARYRDFENDIDARELTRYLMHMHDAWDSNHEAMVSDEIFDICMHDNLSFEIDDIVGFIARFYQHLWAMADLRERLKHYEDLEEQVLKSAEIDIKSMVGEFMHYYNLKKENRLLELPCKVGSKVYQITRNFISEYRIRKFICYDNGNVFFDWECVEGIYVNFHGLHIDEIGKTIFLTKEEAEKALAEMEK
jgi:hypothetical protein